MMKIKVATVRKEANVQIIPVNASLVVKTVNALNALEPALSALERSTPEFVDTFHKNVCDFIKELYDALLENEVELRLVSFGYNTTSVRENRGSFV